MLTKFAAVLVATSLVAGSAFAAPPSGNSNLAPADQTAQTPDFGKTKTAKTGAAKTDAAKTRAAKTVTTHKTVKTAKNRPMHAREHFASGKSRMMHHARHTAPVKTHQAVAGKDGKRS